MSEQNDCIRIGVPPEAPRGDLCADPHFEADQGISRRVFLQGMGTASITLTDARSAELQFPTAKPAGALGHPFPRGVALRVKPILVYDVPTRKDRASWRNYGGISTVESAQG